MNESDRGFDIQKFSEGLAALFAEALHRMVSASSAPNGLTPPAIPDPPDSASASATIKASVEARPLSPPLLPKEPPSGGGAPPGSTQSTASKAPPHAPWLAHAPIPMKPLDGIPLSMPSPPDPVPPLDRQLPPSTPNQTQSEMSVDTPKAPVMALPRIGVHTALPLDNVGAYPGMKGGFSIEDPLGFHESNRRTNWETTAMDVSRDAVIQSLRAHAEMEREYRSAMVSLMDRICKDLRNDYARLEQLYSAYKQNRTTIYDSNV